MLRSVLFVSALALLSLPLAAQDCPMTATVGNFEVEYQSAVYDGASTEFMYCITALDDPDFHALSHWLLELDLDCIHADNLLGCSPEPCFHQIDDPHFGLDGIKFDDLELDKGETECYTFTLEGDWTQLIDDVTVGVKASTDTSLGTICGPHCRNCVGVLELIDQDTDPRIRVLIQHNRPPTILSDLRFRLVDESGKQWQFSMGEQEMTYGSEIRFSKRIADLEALPPGNYTLTMSMGLMSGWLERSLTFEKVE